MQASRSLLPTLPRVLSLLLARHSLLSLLPSAFTARTCGHNRCAWTSNVNVTMTLPSGSQASLLVAAIAGAITRGPQLLAG